MAWNMTACAEGGQRASYLLALLPPPEKRDEFLQSSGVSLCQVLSCSDPIELLLSCIILERLLHSNLTPANTNFCVYLLADVLSHISCPEEENRGGRIVRTRSEGEASSFMLSEEEIHYSLLLEAVEQIDLLPWEKLSNRLSLMQRIPHEQDEVLEAIQVQFEDGVHLVKNPTDGPPNEFYKLKAATKCFETGLRFVCALNDKKQKEELRVRLWEQLCTCLERKLDWSQLVEVTLPSPKFRFDSRTYARFKELDGLIELAPLPRFFQQRYYAYLFKHPN